MKVADVLKCVAQGVSTEEVKTIIAQNKVSADEAIELVKAGYNSESLSGLLDEPEDPKPEDPKPDTKPDNKMSEEIENLKKQLEETQKSLEKAQQANINKDNGPGEKPNPEEYLAKLFAQ